jgi:hypothetical protein
LLSKCEPPITLSGKGGYAVPLSVARVLAVARDWAGDKGRSAWSALGVLLAAREGPFETLRVLDIYVSTKRVDLSSYILCSIFVFCDDRDIPIGRNVGVLCSGHFGSWTRWAFDANIH